MNLLDIILLVPIIWLAYRGFTKGLIIELASLAALILGIIASIHFSWFTAEILTGFFSISEEYLSIVSFIITFVAVVFLVYGIGRLIEKFVDIVALGFLNKLLGGVFGILKSVLFLSAILLIISSLDQNEKLITGKMKEESRLYAPIASIVPMIIPAIDFEEPEKWKV
jgi:membrane protein required for colicin V production